MTFLVLVYFAAISSASFLFSPGTQGQQPLNPHTEVTESRNFSVGFSLQSSYGAAAVIFENANGELETHTRVYEGGKLYQQVMAKLSLASSRHIAYVLYLLSSHLAASANHLL